jgi:hypothetical protein
MRSKLLLIAVVAIGALGAPAPAPTPAPKLENALIYRRDLGIAESPVKLKTAKCLTCPNGKCCKVKRVSVPGLPMRWELEEDLEAEICECQRGQRWLIDSYIIIE